MKELTLTVPAITADHHVCAVRTATVRPPGEARGFPPSATERPT
jgi:hypothetical protein